MPREVSVWLKKIVTENRTSLNNSTLCSLLSCKVNYTKPPSKYTPSKKTRRAAKSATHTQYYKQRWAVFQLLVFEIHISTALSIL